MHLEVSKKNNYGTNWSTIVSVIYIEAFYFQCNERHAPHTLPFQGSFSSFSKSPVYSLHSEEWWSGFLHPWAVPKQSMSLNCLVQCSHCSPPGEQLQASAVDLVSIVPLACIHLCLPFSVGSPSCWHHSLCIIPVDFRCVNDGLVQLHCNAKLSSPQWSLAY